MNKNPPKPHYHVAAGLIWQDGKVLITKRPEGTHLAGLWEFPGGKQEPYETLRTCLERELREELGIKVRVDRHFISVDYEYDTKSITLHVFHCTGLTGRPVALEGQESRWVDPAGLHRYTFPPPDKAVIEALKSENGAENSSGPPHTRACRQLLQKK
ncbi:MAG: 8-oxo-dGTP diphosphatase MutT [Desulfatiglandales bacterium]